MTPRNPLDDKVIVDRELLESLSHCLMEIQGPRRDAINAALAADLTGWAAVPVEPPHRMQIYGEIELPPNHRGYGLEKDVFFAMLEASPPLPGGGE